MTRWVVRLAVLAALLVGLDRLAVGVAQGQLAGRLQTAEGLAQRPSVHLEGFPFLTQVVQGRYDDVHVEVHGLTRGRLVVDRLDVDARGVEVALGDAVQGKVDRVPVSRGSVTAALSFSALETAAASYAKGLVDLRLTSAGSGRVRLDGALQLPGGPYRVNGAADVALRGGSLRLTPLPDVVGSVPAPVRGQARALLTISLPLPALPFGATLTKAEVTSSGLTLRADAAGVVISTRSRG